MKALLLFFLGGSVWPCTRSRGAARAGVMAADLGTSRRPVRHVRGGSLALRLAWGALWVRPTERGALAHGGGEADLGTLETWARAILGGG